MEAKEAFEKILDSIDGENDEVKEQLQTVKEGIAKKYVDKKVNENPILEPFKDQLESYLTNDGGIKDTFLDIFREHGLSLLLTDTEMTALKNVKERLAWMKEVPTEGALASLETEIIWWSTSTPATSQTPEQTNTPETSTPETPSQPTSIEASAEQKPFIEKVYQSAASQIWKPYVWWWVGPNWYDCSWLWNWAFKQQGIDFRSRLTASAFSGADVDITKDKVQAGDFMYWDQKPWTKKHNPIYHIEMVISKPYEKNGKKYVRTLWSSTDAKDDSRNYVWKWVQIREREMKDYRHFWRPPYYYQLAQYEKTWNKQDLAATSHAPSSDIQQRVVA